MPARTCTRLAACLLVAAVAAGGSARANEAAMFDFYVSGIRVGQVSLDVSTTGKNYTAASRIETAGVVGIFADYYFDGTSTGTTAGPGKVVPSRYVARSRSPRAERQSDIEWKGGVPVRAKVEPPRSSAPDPKTQGGTIDPISAGVKLLGRQPAKGICNSTTDIFDGSRRSRITLGAPQPSEDGFACEGHFARLQGEAHTLSSGRESPFRVVFAEVGGGEAEIRRIETSTKFGTAVVQRRE